MECRCNIVEDSGGTAYLNERAVTARKYHFCGECGEVIMPGERYERVNAVVHGKWVKNKTCEGCRRVRDSLMQSWYYGSVWMMLKDCHDIPIEAMPQAFKTHEITQQALSDKRLQLIRLERHYLLTKARRKEIEEEWRVAAW